MATIDLSLERINRLVSHLPPYTRPTIHITGTNGKGSVTSIVASILCESGMKVGKFNSPHLLHPRDSIQIGEKPVEQQRYDTVCKRVEGVDYDIKNKLTDVDGGEIMGASPFEVLTATALQIFEEEQVDMAVIEVGMGGRLDATNILPHEGVIKVSAMTMVDLDHTKWLGSTISAIAQEKAGIARRDAPFVLGPQRSECLEEVENAVQGILERIGTVIRPGAKVSPLPIPDGQATTLGSTIFPPPPTKVVYTPRHRGEPFILDLALRGVHQVDNLSTALGIIECLQEQQDSKTSHPITLGAISRGVANTRWPGRLEFIQYTFETQKSVILLDGAHNVSSAIALRTYIDTILPQGFKPAPNSNFDNTRPVSFVIALSDSPPKTPSDTLTPLLRPGDRVAVARFSNVEGMPWVRPVDIDEIRHVAKSLVGNTGEMWDGEWSFEPNGNLKSLEEALKWAGGNAGEGLVVVAGSLYLAADFYRLMEAYPQKFQRL